MSTQLYSCCEDDLGSINCFKISSVTWKDQLVDFVKMESETCLLCKQLCLNFLTKTFYLSLERYNCSMRLRLIDSALSGFSF